MLFTGEELESLWLDLYLAQKRESGWILVSTDHMQKLLTGLEQQGLLEAEAQDRSQELDELRSQVNDLSRDNHALRQALAKAKQILTGTPL